MVIRSALVLKLLVWSPSGAVAAAATTALPEALGGARNWDYRFCWVRDATFTLDALMRLRSGHEAHRFFWWLLEVSDLTHPELRVLYPLDGSAEPLERCLDLEGYRRSTPVRAGNAAGGQFQLGIYGDLLQSAWIYAREGYAFDEESASRLAEVADHVCRVWDAPDSGIWEVRNEPRHFTHSKMMCAVALERACWLAERGHLPGRSRSRWRETAARIREFVERCCWSDEKGSYVQAAGSSELDASLLLGAVMGYADGDDSRLQATVDAVRRTLGDGPLLYRYRNDDGLGGEEGAFLACSFWLVDALARIGRLEDAADTMEALIERANDVGLYAEEIDPDTGAFLGNMPQALVHLALVNAAVSFAQAQR